MKKVLKKLLPIKIAKSFAINCVQHIFKKLQNSNVTSRNLIIILKDLKVIKGYCRYCKLFPGT